MLRAALLASLLCSSCYFTRSAVVPVPSVPHGDRGPEAKGLLVFLPGIMDGPEHFDRHGFVEHVKSLHSDWDVVSVDAHFAYYREETVFQRLEEDIIGPALARGYDQIWLVGISMGGYGALAYAMSHEEQIDGVIVLAPYMIWDDPLMADTIRRYRADPNRSPSLYIGFGNQDRFRENSIPLASVLPRRRVSVKPGGHEWTTWRELFMDLVNRALWDGSMRASR